MHGVTLVCWVPLSPVLLFCVLARSCAARAGERAGSHLIQTVLELTGRSGVTLDGQSGSPRLFALILKRAFLGCGLNSIQRLRRLRTRDAPRRFLIDYARHDVANFVLQAALHAAHDKDDAKALLKELVPAV